MPQRSKIVLLPPELKEELDRLLIENGFSDYRGLADFLTERGHPISHAAVHRYGEEFEAKMMAIKLVTEQAKAICGTVGDDEGAVNDALIRLVQQKAFDVLMKMQANDSDTLAKVFPKMGLMVARLSRASVIQKKWQAETREKVKKAVQNIEDKTKSRKKSLDPETLRIIREEIYGIV